ncbi:MmgE/PrpD family protein [Parasphingorhabdus halotolerans]|uniref:MmgE/PrpD family protein n=1 Tax=Parasphingorhabdus halotolerans TaxID=2725558 RepID=A0A6H2DP00_9SPHN|nr:MmgE/PrpD family protein [Parasphingorhabdus halotolerans]QJB69481.1 MmgE/PrpD family protein [Parasphingorhabdus halotolerans]
MTQESLTEKLAKHLMRPVDEATRQRARLHLLDWLGCVAGARQSDLAEQQLGYKEENIASKAAWLGNIMEMDDIHRSSILHPGPVIWPTLMVGGQYAMDDILDAAIKGYEATIAIGSTFDDCHYRFYHNTSTAGVFGAAAAVSSLYGSDLDKTVSALGLAGSVSGGLWQMRHENTDAKQWHIERALSNGGSAGFYAAHGAVGPRFILEGPQGLYAATCENPKRITFPRKWRIHEVSFKPWGACRHAHPAIDAALELKAKLGSLDGEVLVETYADAITFCDRPDPQTVVDAKFSLQQAVAVVAEKGVPELADFEQDAIAAFAKARRRVTVKAAEDVTARYPEHYGARITCSGQTFDLVDTQGDPERPLSRDGIIGKARALIAWGRLPDVEADRAIDLALNGDDPEAIHKMLRDWLS